MNILYQFDNKYAPYGGVSITSLLENNQTVDEVIVYVLDDDGNPISQDNRNKLISLESRFANARIKIIDASKLARLIEELNIPTYRGCNAANMRLFIDVLLPSIEGKLLYLDADTLVCGPLDKLFQSSIDYVSNIEKNILTEKYSSKTIGMVLESQGCEIKKELGLTETRGYYNSGVILFDIDKWKQNNCSEKIIEHARNIRAAYASPDQDLLNVVLKNEIYPLNLQYNFQPMHAVYSANIYQKVYHTKPYYLQSDIKKTENEFSNVLCSFNRCINTGFILHCYRYLGTFPWHKNTKHPFADIWDYYLSISPWKSLEKQNETISAVIKIEMFLHLILPKRFFLFIFKWTQKQIQVYMEKKLR